MLDFPERWIPCVPLNLPLQPLPWYNEIRMSIGVFVTPLLHRKKLTSLCYFLGITVTRLVDHGVHMPDWFTPNLYFRGRKQML